MPQILNRDILKVLNISSVTFKEQQILFLPIEKTLTATKENSVMWVLLGILTATTPQSLQIDNPLWVISSYSTVVSSAGRVSERKRLLLQQLKQNIWL